MSTSTPPRLDIATRAGSRWSWHSTRSSRLVANVIGATGAGFFAWAGYRHFITAHSLIGAGFWCAQLWVVAAYLLRRPARVVSSRALDWALAFGGTFAGILYRPDGLHLHEGMVAGTALQVVGLSLWGASFVALGRSFGFAAADRGLKQRGPYAVVRHPLYSSYFLLQLGYVAQSLSWRNIAVMILVCGCDVARALVEERVLEHNIEYARYRQHARWRCVPGIW